MTVSNTVTETAYTRAELQSQRVVSSEDRQLEYAEKLYTTFAVYVWTQSEYKVLLKPWRKLSKGFRKAWFRAAVQSQYPFMDILAQEVRLWNYPELRVFYRLDAQALLFLGSLHTETTYRVTERSLQKIVISLPPFDWAKPYPSVASDERHD